MAITNRQKGDYFERTVRDDFIENGWYVTRAAGSKGAGDLHATRDGVTALVQCKTSGSLPPGEWNDLLTKANKCGALPILAERVKRKRVYSQIVFHKTDKTRAERTVEWSPK